MYFVAKLFISCRPNGGHAGNTEVTKETYVQTYMQIYNTEEL